jgi:putative glutamine amidotransferase
LPVLGVCRGLQLINVSCKGTLVQDLGPQGDEVHENTSGADKLHPVAIVGDSLLAAIAGGEKGMANSAHHQAIDRLGEGLKINCRAGDDPGEGTIEGIEWADPAGKPFLLAVQWHPERMFVNALPHPGLYRAIRDRFIEEVKKSTATT